VVCLGKATKFADSYQAMTKVYSGVMKLGRRPRPWMRIRRFRGPKIGPTSATGCFRKLPRSSLGDQLQVPPMYSAIKVKGEKMYDKARRGESLDLPPAPSRL